MSDDMSEYCDSLSAEYELVGIHPDVLPSVANPVFKFIHPADRYPPRV